jgi:ribonuclease Z
MRPVELRFGDLRLEGWSRAGDETWVRVHPPGLAFDAGRGALQLGGAQDVFLTHGHLDHALGLPYVLSQRSLHRLVHTRVFCPAEIAEPVQALITAAERLENAHYIYDLVPLAPGARVPVGRDLVIEAFPTDHVVPSLGYHLWKLRRRLAPEYVGLPPAELIALRGRGVETAEVVEDLWLSYCGDTGPGVFTAEPRVFASKVLVLECTFLGDKHRDKGARFKHLHLEDIVERRASFHNEALVLQHLSRRHKVAELRDEIRRLLPALAPRIHFLVEEEMDS